MNVFRCLVVLYILFVIPSGVYAQEEAEIHLDDIKHPVKPMLWKIEGKGLEKPSYLFGTIHLADPRVTKLHPLAQKAFNESATVFTEIDLSAVKQLAAAALLMRNDGQELEQLIGKEMVVALSAEIKAINPAYNLKPFQGMKVWALAFILPQLKNQLQGKVALDVLLWQRAKKADKTRGALETVHEQLGQLDKLSLEEQKQLLDVTLKMYKLAREKKVNPYQGIIDAYLMGDKAAIEKQLTQVSYMGLKVDPELSKKFMKLLLHARNKTMVESIQKALTKPDADTHFFAAGTAHYIGENSINKLLKKAGYTVTPVTP